MYFENFPRFLYDFETKPGHNHFIGVTDITRNIRFKTEFINSLSVYETYKMADGESIEHVSEKIYGTPEYHWILMLLNERYDYVEDFALSSQHFERAMQRKYGHRMDDAKYFVDKNGMVTNAIVDMTIENTEQDNTGLSLLNSLIKVGSVIRRKTSIGYYAGRVEEIDPDTKQLKVMFTTGDMKVGDPIEVIHYFDDEDGNYVERFLANSKVLSVSIPDKYNMITNYEYEYLQNENKRIIKIVPQRYLAQVLSEFEALVSE